MYDLKLPAVNYHSTGKMLLPSCSQVSKTFFFSSNVVESKCLPGRGEHRDWDASGEDKLVRLGCGVSAMPNAEMSGIRLFSKLAVSETILAILTRILIRSPIQCERNIYLTRVVSTYF